MSGKDEFNGISVDIYPEVDRDGNLTVEILTGRQNNKIPVSYDEHSEKVPHGFKTVFKELLGTDPQDLNNLAYDLIDLNDELKESGKVPETPLEFLGKEFTYKIDLKNAQSQGGTAYKKIGASHYINTTSERKGIKISPMLKKKGLRVTFWESDPIRPKSYFSEEGNNISNYTFSGDLRVIQVDRITIKKEDSEVYNVGDIIPKILVEDSKGARAQMIFWREVNNDLPVSSGDTIQVEGFGFEDTVKWGRQLHQRDNSEFSFR